MIEPINDGGYAFPRGVDAYGSVNDGMTLRDWFAGQCNPSIYNPKETFFAAHGRSPSAEQLAEWIAYIRLLEADAMIKAREVRP